MAIERVVVENDLVLSLDHHFQFGAHIANILWKSHPKLGFILRNATFFNDTTLSETVVFFAYTPLFGIRMHWVE